MKRILTPILTAAAIFTPGLVTAPPSDAASAYHWYATTSRGVSNSCTPTINQITNGHHGDVQWTARSIARKDPHLNSCTVWYRATTNFAGGHLIDSTPELYRLFPQRVDYTHLPY